ASPRSTSSVVESPGAIGSDSSSPDGPSTSSACVVCPSFETVNVTVPALPTEGSEGVILYSVSESCTLPAAPEEVVTCAPPPLSSLLESLSSPQPATASAPAASAAIGIALIRNPLLLDAWVYAAAVIPVRSV